MEPDEAASPSEADFDRALRRAYALASLAILLGETFWLIDTRLGTQPSRTFAAVRRRWPKMRGWWGRVSAPGHARANRERIAFEAAEFLERQETE